MRLTTPTLNIQRKINKTRTRLRSSQTIALACVFSFTWTLIIGSECRAQGKSQHQEQGTSQSKVLDASEGEKNLKSSFSLKSSTIQSGQPLSEDQVFNGFGCNGKNRSPQLEWTDPPPGTQSFAITVFDPDAPTGSGWWHWVIFNLPPDVRKLDLDASRSKTKPLPRGAIQSMTDFGKPGYGGPCPPVGHPPHHYYFRVYALKTKLTLGASTPAAQVGYFIGQNKLAEAELMATFKR